ncbi:hypothetical protein [Actinopolymorpha pittospori]|uniref:Uncharacterized protein n=1 Tax=Actinopolymorpha pittospori TaxID=648752 RepID=A0A927MYU3_9ACTN|nr:hypothetical protein [Actinopolymorpha pittospori]MBE1609471.1 hypothetical protein [Actinopolymorpha pittospori]
MGDKKQDRTAIEKAAQTVAENDYPHFKAAVEYARQYTTLGPNALGLVSSSERLREYAPARDSQIRNLGDGLKKLEEAIKGLSTVAYRMAVTEVANTIDLTKVPKLTISKPSKVHVDKSPSAPGVHLVAASLQLTASWSAATFLKCYFSRLMLFGSMATVTVSLSMWATVQPDDDEIGTVMSGWLRVAEQLDQVGSLGRMDSKDNASLPRSVWDDDARDAFDRWAGNFQIEVAQAADEARGATRALDDALSAIEEIQKAMVGFDSVTAGFLLALFLIGMVPVFRAQAAVAQQVIALSNSLATCFSVGTIVGQAATYGYKMRQLSGAGAFHKLRIDNDPNQSYGTDEVNDTFTDLDVDWLRS